jgi:hypothetical protein
MFEHTRGPKKRIATMGTTKGLNKNDISDASRRVIIGISISLVDEIIMLSLALIFKFNKNF